MYNSQVTKLSYALWHHKPSYKLELVTQCEKNFDIVLEFVTRDFKENKI